MKPNIKIIFRNQVHFAFIEDGLYEYTLETENKICEKSEYNDFSDVDSVSGNGKFWTTELKEILLLGEKVTLEHIGVLKVIDI